MKITIKFQQRESTTVSESVFAKEVQVRPQLELGPLDKKDTDAIYKRLVAGLGTRKGKRAYTRFK